MELTEMELEGVVGGLNKAPRKPLKTPVFSATPTGTQTPQPAATPIQALPQASPAVAPPTIRTPAREKKGCLGGVCPL